MAMYSGDRLDELERIRQNQPPARPAWENQTEAEPVSKYHGGDQVKAGLVVYGKAADGSGEDEWRFGPQFTLRAWFARPHRLPDGSVDTRFELQVKHQLLTYAGQRLRDLWVLTTISSPASDLVSESLARPTHSDANARLERAFSIAEVDDITQHQATERHDLYETNKRYMTSVVRLESLAPRSTSDRVLPDQPKTQRYLGIEKAHRRMNELRANRFPTQAAPTDLLAVAEALLGLLPADLDRSIKREAEQVLAYIREARWRGNGQPAATPSARSPSDLLTLVSTVLAHAERQEKKRNFTNPYYCIGLCAAPELVGRPRRPGEESLTPPALVVHDLVSSARAHELLHDARARIPDDHAEALLKMAARKALAGPRAEEAEYYERYERQRRPVMDLVTELYQASVAAFVKREATGGQVVVVAPGETSDELEDSDE